MSDGIKHGSLFSGIGGFDLAAEWMGWENVFHCEKEPFCQKVLKYYFPEAISYEDITTTDFTVHRRQIDILTGGFPCQPYSTAGKRKGKEDDRHLWPEMLRAIREIKPRYIVGENVYGIVNWNAGLVFNEVQTDLENEGYKVQPVVLPACAVNAPHRRDRVWFVAYNNDRNREKVRFQARREKHLDRNERNRATANTSKKHNGGNSGKSKKRPAQQSGNSTQPKVNSDTSQVRLQRSKQTDRSQRQECNDEQSDGCRRKWNNAWEQWPTQSPICSRDDGLSERLDGITFPKWRRKSIKAYGNAIVPQVAYQIFKALMISESKGREEKNIINSK